MGLASYLLIGFYHARGASRRAALQALLVTTLGGLVMHELGRIPSSGDSVDLPVVVTLREDDEDAAWAVGMALLVVQTSPAGGADALAARVVDAPSLRIGAAGGPFVLDVVYADWPTAFARTMSARGATVVSGLDMLVHQAAAQFELFTGHTAPIADMMEAGRAAVK